MTIKTVRARYTGPRSIPKSVVSPPRSGRSLGHGAITAAIALCLAGCKDSAAPPVDLTNVPNASVAVGTEFRLHLLNIGGGWVLPPPISSASVTYFKAVPPAYTTDPGPGPWIFYFKATTAGRAVITLQEVHGSDSVSIPPFVDTVDVH